MKIALVKNLQRQATKLLAELHKTKEAILIIEHGQPSAYLVGFQEYELMQHRLALLDSLSKGEKACLDHKTLTHSQAKERMVKWLK